MRPSHMPEPVIENARLPEKEAPPMIKGVLNASKLAGIERDLERADLNRIMRRQPVCAVLAYTTSRSSACSTSFTSTSHICARC